jgi:F420H(2)-dependent quinone reductase
MTLQGEYVPSAFGWVRDQVETYERSGGQEANTLRDTGIPVIIVTMRGKKSGTVRKIALMRVEHDGEYALVASKGGHSEHPVWYHNLKAHPDVELQDRATKRDYAAREVFGDEKAVWWERAVAAWPDYAKYQEKTDRQIPVFVLEPIDAT